MKEQPLALVSESKYLHGDLIRRASDIIGRESVAIFSNDMHYRYSLRRQWRKSGKLLTFIMLNPSTADEVHNDPTLERCERRAMMNGYAGFRVVNIFAYRATDPSDMKKSMVCPIGVENDNFLSEVFQEQRSGASDIICGWGTHGAFLRRGEQVLDLMRLYEIAPMCLKFTKDNYPAHPLYLPYDLKPIPLPENPK